jgi:crossover junction endodeoxyribonuclease RuvC
MCLRILGVDPGSRLTGYGVVEKNGQRISAVACGTLRLPVESEVTMPERLYELYVSLKKIIQTYQPSVLVVEKVFVAKNALSALKLGQARGVVLALGAEMGLRVFEYSPTHVKSALTGNGHAAKDQVARVVRWILDRGAAGARGATCNETLEFETADASDALSLALAHALLTREDRHPVREL